jgi:hypothetical protein
MTLSRLAALPSVSVALLAGILLPQSAAAMGAVFGKDGEQVALATSRIAVAESAARTALWAQVSVTGASGGFLWVLPVRPGARVDLGSDAWLDALDAATSPVILPGPASLACDAGGAPERVPPVVSAATAKPSASSIFADPESLAAFAGESGYALPEASAGPLASVFSSGGLVFAATFDSAALPTHTLRVVESAEAALPFALGAAMPTVDARVTAFVLAAESASAGPSPLTLDPVSVVWTGGGTSTYVDARDALVESYGGTRWLTESSLPDLLFDGVSVAQSAPLPAVLADYFSLAGAYGDTKNDPSVCASAAYATRTLTTPYAVLCPAGTLAVAPGGASPCTTDDAGDGSDGETAIEPLVCGGTSDDAAIAVAALAPSDIWLTRIDGLVTATTASDVPVTLGPAAPSSPVVTAAAFTRTCATPSAPSQSPTSTSGSGESTPSTPSPPDNSAATAAAAEGCGAAMDSCGSDDESDSSGDSGCGSSSGSDDDSSSSGCGSSSGSDDSDSNNGCETARAAGSTRGLRLPARRRSPVSRVLVGLAALAIALRRRSRRADTSEREADGRP